MLILGGDSESSKKGFSDLLIYSVQCNIWLKIPTFMSDDMIIVSRKHIEYLGVPITSRLGLTSTKMNSGCIYIIGGSSSHISDKLVKMYFPEDLCRLFDNSSEDCLNFPGCNFCQANGHDISSFCYSNLHSRDKGPGANFHLKVGPFCNKKWFFQAEKDCDTFQTCRYCLAQFSIYGSSPAKSSCQWCHGCDRGGKCIPQEGDCNREIYCYGRQEGIHEPIKCPELDQCSVSDCNKCSQSKCFLVKIC